jgi:cytochrome oxidase Cu insertion factor (SCO1/SenC/PrrC family)
MAIVSVQQEQPGSKTKQRPTAGRLALILGLPVLVVAALVAVIVVVTGSRSAQHTSAEQVQFREAANNPDVDPGTSLPGVIAPAVSLTDQFGQRVSLHQFSGKVIVLAFVDARCTTICPLSTVSMTEAVHMLGPAAAKQVQLVGIDANPDATKVADVRAYSQAHQMMHSWDFLTGSDRELAAVWRAYHVYVAASHGDIDHEPAIYLIDQQGKERTLYLTQMAYAGVGQQADLIADGIARLLPGHPAPHHLVPLQLAKSIRPDAPVSLPVIGGADQARAVPLGPGHPHVLVFLASWVSEISDLPAELRLLSSYQQRAASQHWPSVVAIDESQAETDLSALPAQLANAGGSGLGYPVVADTSGRVADGYSVQDLPWIEITSSAGQVLVKHDGWLSSKALIAAVTKTTR